MSKSWRTVSVERSRPEEASKSPDEIYVPRRQPQPPAEAGCTSQRPVPARRAVGVSGEQTAACTTLQAQVAFRRARRATVRGLGGHAGQARHNGRGVDSEGLSAELGCQMCTKSMALTIQRAEASGGWKDCTYQVTLTIHG